MEPATTTILVMTFIRAPIFGAAPSKMGRPFPRCVGIMAEEPNGFPFSSIHKIVATAWANTLIVAVKPTVANDEKLAFQAGVNSLVQTHFCLGSTKAAL